MPKYKVGDVAALFPKPATAKTDSGRKMQSLFEDFYSKSKKFKNPAAQKLETHTEEDSKPTPKRNVNLENKGEKNKPLKRKFNDFDSPDSSLLDSKKRKKLEVKSETEYFPRDKHVKNKTENSNDEVYFPRNNKKANFHPQTEVKSISAEEVNATESYSDIAVDKTEIKRLKKEKRKLRRQQENSKGMSPKSGTVQNNVSLSKSTNKNILNQNKAHKKNFKVAEKEIGAKKNFKMTQNSDQMDGKKEFLNKKSSNPSTVVQHSKPKHIIYQDLDSNNHKIKSPKKVKKKQLKQLIEEKAEQSEDSESDGKLEAPHTKNIKKAKNLEIVLKPSKVDFSESSGTENDSESEEKSSLKKAKTVKKMQSKNKLQNSISVPEEESESEDIIPKKVKKKPKVLSEKPTAISEEQLSRTLFVGNLPVNITRKEMEKLFHRFGPIESSRLRGAVPTKVTIPKKIADIKNKYHSGVHSRIGYVVMKERKDAIEAISLSGLVYDDHHIVVDRASHVGEKKMYDEKCSVFVGNLPFDVEDELMWSTFIQFGDIESVRVIRDKDTGVGKGFGYIAFLKIQGKENALAATDVEVGGRKVRIKSVENKQKQTSITPWNAIKRIAWKEKKEQTNNSRKSLKKIMKKGKLQQQRKKIANIFNRLPSKGK